jgi:hypothetical protein
MNYTVDHDIDSIGLNTNLMLRLETNYYKFKSTSDMHFLSFSHALSSPILLVK